MQQANLIVTPTGGPNVTLAYSCQGKYGKRQLGTSTAAAPVSSGAVTTFKGEVVTFWDGFTSGCA